ncbi:leucine-rich repeat and calponin homology domain-containing protein 4-like isoform X2 [Myxocyprinus asiaticus]|uniref:leucine-rich repeat and calponin homology domain-containing protein 4-like isoform X2 n=1 Tax=Myxocyprinus asiaticus TaxID=70543 RepID=UPI002222BE7F|nr:leucine-rich repeat and calponin homology domain-containing protein 4-like isoform X2 [Myxocyprinus asiaticus]
MAAGDGAQLPATVAASRSVEKALEEAASSGALILSNRKLKEFPSTARNYDLSDITHADLSKNRLCEVPEAVCQFVSLETLSLYHNCVRSLTPNLCQLQALTYLNLSRNQLSSLPLSVCQLPLLRVLIVSNNKLSVLPATIHTLTHLRQLDVSCNELQSLPVELGQLECLRDLNLRRNQLTALPEELSELPLVRLDVSCNRISHVPVCYRHLRHLQTIILDNNPLQMPPAQICSKGKFHIFKYLNMEACKRTQDQFEKALRPTAFNSCLSNLLDQDLFPSQYGALDSGFNSVDSGSKRWSGNESADDFSERSLRLTEISREHTNFQEEEERDMLLKTPKVNGDLEQADFMYNSVTEEEEERCQPPHTEPSQEKSESTNSTPSQSPESTGSRIFVIGDGSDYVSPSSPTLEEKRRPGNLLIWQERERAQQQRDRASTLQKITVKTGSNSATTTKLGGTGSVSGGDSSDSSSPPNGLKQRCASVDQVSSSSHPVSLQHSISRPDATVKPCSPTSSAPKPNSFLFRTSSRCNVKTGSANSLAESGRSESRSTLKSPREERVDVLQLRKSLESRLKITLPEDLGEALSNGTVLCQLANHVRPRSVSIIHIPSPAVPKLSAAKCRLNVENFIAACRRLGVPEDTLCPSQLILEEEGLTRVAQTVQALLEIPTSGSRRLSRQDPSGMTLQCTTHNQDATC